MITKKSLIALGVTIVVLFVAQIGPSDEKLLSSRFPSLRHTEITRIESKREGGREWTRWLYFEGSSIEIKNLIEGGKLGNRAQKHEWDYYRWVEFPDAPALPAPEDAILFVLFHSGKLHVSVTTAEFKQLWTVTLRM